MCAETNKMNRLEETTKFSRIEFWYVCTMVRNVASFGPKPYFWASNREILACRMHSTQSYKKRKSLGEEIIVKLDVVDR